MLLELLSSETWGLLGTTVLVVGRVKGVADGLGPELVLLAALGAGSASETPNGIAVSSAGEVSGDMVLNTRRL